MTSERVFVAFDTGRGLAYVQVSGWQRAYLLWTFRNFRSLPQKILNVRQRELVETLYRSPSVKQAHELDGATVIGTVDDFRPSFPAMAPVSAVAERLVPSFPAKKLAVVSTRTFGEQLHTLYDRLALLGLTRRVGAGALVAVMAVLGWQLLRSRPVVSASKPNSAVMPHASIDIGPGMVPTLPNPDVRPLALAKITGASPITVTRRPTVSVPGATANQSARSFSDSGTQRGSQVSNKRGTNQIPVSTHHAVTDRTAMQDSSAAAPRMRIAGPPRKLVYPVCPDSRARGKVSLQAVVAYDGTVNRVKVLAGNRLLAAAATRAIREWRYQPFSAEGQRLERETRITVSFISNDVVAVSFPDDAPVSR